MKKMATYEWILLIVAFAVAAALLTCCAGDGEPCTPTNRAEWWVEGLCCEEGDVVACDPATGLGQPCDPTSGWQDLYPDLCCRDNVLVTCEAASNDSYTIDAPDREVAP